MTDRSVAKLPFAFFAVYLAALLSGAAGLGYEIVWSRMLVPPLGNSADATSLVLAAFMIGIALGARLLGGAADRVRSPLGLYGALEGILGCFALGMPALIRALGNVPALQGSMETAPVSAVLRLLAAGALVALPSLVMGATIPVLVRVFSARSHCVEREVGLVYGANTIGAAFGAAVFGFLAIPALGLRVSGMAAAAGSFAAALIAFAIERFAGDQDEWSASPAATETSSGMAHGRSVAAAALGVAAVGGFAMLAAEVLWARVLTFVFGHDTYAFAMLLAVVLFGLGLGGLLHRRLSRYDQVAVTTVLAGLFALGLVASFWSATKLVIGLGHDPFSLGAGVGSQSSLWLEFYRELAYTPVLVLVPSILSGALFPAAAAVYAHPVERAGSRVGTAALVNGVAAAAGSMLAAFGLLGWLGIEGTLVAVALLAAAASLLMGACDRRRSLRFRLLGFAPAGLAVILAIALPTGLPRALLQEAVGPRHQQIMHYEEGRTSTVSVTKNTLNAEKQLFVNAVNEVTTRLVHDQSFKLLGHLGPLLHPNPRRGLMICLGAGIAAGAALRHPFERLDVVELSSSIPRATRLWEAENNRVQDDPRFKLHIADGRHYLRANRERYDVIIVDSTHPKSVDSWLLYTEEFYRIAKERLGDDGLLVQWVPLHGLSELEFKIIVRTFQAVFEDATLWVNVGFEPYGQAAYVKLVGGKHPLVIDYQQLAGRLALPVIREDLAPFGMAEPVELLDCFLGGPAAIAAWTEGLPLQTDDRAIVPYTTAHSQGRRMEAGLLLPVRSSVLDVLTNTGAAGAELTRTLGRASDAQGFLLAGLLSRAAETWPGGHKIALFQKAAAAGRDYYLKLAALYGDVPDRQFEIASYLGNLGLAEDARGLYEKAAGAEPSDPRYAINLGLVLLDLGEVDAAVRLLGQAASERPGSALAAYDHGVALLRSGAFEQAVSELRRAVVLDASQVGAELSLAEALLALGQTDEAEIRLQRVVRDNPFVAEAFDLLGLAAARAGRFDDARRKHLRAIELEPYRATAHYNLGVALDELRRPADAAAAYQAALSIDPRDAEAHNNLGLAYARLGRFKDAAAEARRAIDDRPEFPEALFNLGLAYRALHQNAQALEVFAAALALRPDLEPAKRQLAELAAIPVEGKGSNAVGTP